MSNNSIPQEFFKNANPENKVIFSSLEQRADDFARAMDGLAERVGMPFVLEAPTKPFCFGREAVEFALSQIARQELLDVQTCQARKS